MIGIRSLVVALLVAAALGSQTQAGFIYIPNGYHAQQTSFFCGPASMQMMLDSPAVQALNPGLPSQLALWSTAQQFNVSPMLGTDPIAFAATMNLADGANHNYAWYGFTPNAFSANAASRTVADALRDYNIPATVAVNHGQHWVDVNGVTTIGNIQRNQPYLITGFFIRDPWPLAGTLGYNTWLAYNTRAWFRVFNPTPFAPVLPYSGQYVIEVEPVGPEPRDNGLNNSNPPPPSTIPELTAGQAITYATNDLASDSDLNGQYGLINGGFDPNAADALLLQYPDDSITAGDWLVPYDGSGGINDVTGALLIDADTGTIDQATWITAGQSPWTLSQIDQLYLNEYSGNLVADDIFASLIPEPTSLALFGPLLLTLLGWRWQRRRSPP